MVSFGRGIAVFLRFAKLIRLTAGFIFSARLQKDNLLFPQGVGLRSTVVDAFEKKTGCVPHDKPLSFLEALIGQQLLRFLGRFVASVRRFGDGFKGLVEPWRRKLAQDAVRAFLGNDFTGGFLFTGRRHGGGLLCLPPSW